MFNLNRKEATHTKTLKQYTFSFLKDNIQILVGYCIHKFQKTYEIFRHFILSNVRRLSCYLSGDLTLIWGFELKLLEFGIQEQQMRCRARFFGPCCFVLHILCRNSYRTHSLQDSKRLLEESNGRFDFFNDRVSTLLPFGWWEMSKLS